MQHYLSDYELDFGGGHKVYTHVIWAVEEGHDDGHEHEHE